MERQKPILWLLTAIVAGCLMLVSSAGILLAFWLPGREADSTPILLACAGLVGLAFAIALLGVSRNAWHGRPSPTVYSRRSWLVLLGGWVLMGVGAFVLPAPLHSAVWFAPFHLAMIAFPALLLFSLVTLAAGREAAPTRRQTVISVGGGIFFMGGAMLLELLGLLFNSFLVVMLAALTPAGQVEVDRLLATMQHWAQLAPDEISLESVLALLASPVILGILALTLAVFTPIIEEIGKTVFIALLGYWKRPGLLTAFLWGVASGLGFAIVEGIFNGGLGLLDMNNWFVGVTMRIPATAMHALTSGLVGLGWGCFWQQRRRWVLPLSYLAALSFHGLWNLSAVGIIGGVAFSATAFPALSFSSSTMVGFLCLGFLTFLVLLTPVGLLGIPLMLRKKAPAGTTAPHEMGELCS
ncbi:MAG: PrsW family intramembrane metalloprotease [Anaerolineae bacterium]|nr:PrsW family intramembrane metalloprotease [Anaerolineae bacterium]